MGVKMPLQLKVPTAKPKSLSSFHGTYVVDRELTPHKLS